MKKALLLIIATASTALTSYATTVLPGWETPLQTILDSRVTGTSIDVNSSQVADDSYWTANLNPAAYLVIEIAGYAATNAFGLYEIGDPSNKLQVFDGAATGMSGQVNIVVPATWKAFGYYMENSVIGFTWYSDASLNANGGKDHFVAFQGATGATLGNATFDSNDYVLAIEDTNLGDQDYNDMVVLVQNVKPVPEGGATLALLGFGLVAIHAIRRKLSLAK